MAKLWFCLVTLLLAQACTASRSRSTMSDNPFYDDDDIVTSGGGLEADTDMHWKMSDVDVDRDSVDDWDDWDDWDDDLETKAREMASAHLDDFLEPFDAFQNEHVQIVGDLDDRDRDEGTEESGASESETWLWSRPRPRKSPSSSSLRSSTPNRKVQQDIKKRKAAHQKVLQDQKKIKKYLKCSAKGGICGNRNSCNFRRAFKIVYRLCPGSTYCCVPVSMDSRRQSSLHRREPENKPVKRQSLWRRGMQSVTGKFSKAKKWFKRKATKAKRWVKRKKKGVKRRATKAKTWAKNKVNKILGHFHSWFHRRVLRKAKVLFNKFGRSIVTRAVRTLKKFLAGGHISKADARGVADLDVDSDMCIDDLRLDDILTDDLDMADTDGLDTMSDQNFLFYAIETLWDFLMWLSDQGQPQEDKDLQFCSAGQLRQLHAEQKRKCGQKYSCSNLKTELNPSHCPEAVRRLENGVECMIARINVMRCFKHRGDQQHLDVFRDDGEQKLILVVAECVIKVSYCELLAATAEALAKLMARLYETMLEWMEELSKVAYEILVDKYGWWRTLVVCILLCIVLLFLFGGVTVGTGGTAAVAVGGVLVIGGVSIAVAANAQSGPLGPA